MYWRAQIQNTAHLFRDIPCFLFVIYLFTKAFYVVVDSFLDDLYRNLALAYLVYCGVLVLKVLVYLEEVAHFVESVSGELIDVFVLIVVGIVEGNGDNLLVVSAVVDHGDNSDGVCSYKSHRLERLGAEKKNVKRVSVVAVGSRNESVVCGIVGRGIEDTVEDYKSCFLLELVFFAASLGYFNNADKILRGYSFG